MRPNPLPRSVNRHRPRSHRKKAPACADKPTYVARKQAERWGSERLSIVEKWAGMNGHNVPPSR
jgi:hypothetical protein